MMHAKDRRYRKLYLTRLRRTVPFLFYLIIAFVVGSSFLSLVTLFHFYTCRAKPFPTPHYRFPYENINDASLNTVVHSSHRSTTTSCERNVLRSIYGWWRTVAAFHTGTLLEELPLFTSVSNVIAGRTSLPVLYKDGAFVCGMAFLYSGLCAEDEESVLRCARRAGVATLNKLLPSICQDTPYYVALAEALAKMESRCGVPATPSPLPLGVVDETQLLTLPDELVALALAPGSALIERAYGSEGLTAEEEAAVRRAYYVPVAQRAVAHMPPPLKCSAYTTYPIGFAVTQRPASMRYRARRLFPFFPVTPNIHGECQSRRGDVREQYVLVDRSRHEWLYATLMRYSMFGYSHKRGGWACLRNQEMMFYGVVPVLVDLPLAGPLLISNTPRQLMLDVLLQEPLLQKVGHMQDNHTILVYNRSAVHLTNGTYFRGCESGTTNFVRPGELDLEPYEAEHQQHYAKKGVASPPPLTHLSPAVVPHFDYWARQLWDSYPRHSAAAMVQYLLNTVGCPDPRRVLVIGYSHFPVDYTHQSIVTGFSDLGIFVDTFVQLEGDMFKRLSFYNHSKERDGTWTPEERTALEKLRADNYLGDPRTIGMREWEKQRGDRLQQGQGSFSMMGRWNPLLVRRIDGSAERPMDTQDWQRASEKHRKRMDARLLSLLEEGGGNRYDLVIYSVAPYEEFFRDRSKLPLFDHITAHIRKDKIVFVDHMDFISDAYHINFGKAMSKYGWVFQRELFSRCAVS